MACLSQCATSSSKCPNCLAAESSKRSHSAIFSCFLWPISSNISASFNVISPNKRDRRIYIHEKDTHSTILGIETSWDVIVPTTRSNSTGDASIALTTDTTAWGISWMSGSHCCRKSQAKALFHCASMDLTSSKNFSNRFARPTCQAAITRKSFKCSFHLTRFAKSEYNCWEPHWSTWKSMAALWNRSFASIICWHCARGNCKAFSFLKASCSCPRSWSYKPCNLWSLHRHIGSRIQAWSLIAACHSKAPSTTWLSAKSHSKVTAKSMQLLSKHSPIRSNSFARSTVEVLWL